MVVVAFFFVLLLMLRGAADRLVPGLGTAVAAILGLGTMLLPFADNFFSHVPSATLAFASFRVVLGGARSPSPRRLVLAGVLAGLAGFVETPVLIVSAIVGCYAASWAPHLRRGALFGAGLVAGLLPLAAYDTWAFGSPFSTGYADAVQTMGVSGHDVIGANSRGFFGLTYPHLHALVALLFSARGFFVLTPITMVAIAGLLLLYRQGSRREAITVLALAVALLLYNAAYYLPFGGYTPGPRFLMPLLPFLALPLAMALDSWTMITLAAAALSAFWMMSATVAQPLLPTALEPTAWVGRIVHDHTLTGSILTQGQLGVVAFVVPALAALTLVALETRAGLQSASR